MLKVDHYFIEKKVLLILYYMVKKLLFLDLKIAFVVLGSNFKGATQENLFYSDCYEI